MKNLLRNLCGTAVLFATSVAFGAIPSVTVTVADAGGKAAFKGATNASGTFATGKLQPGNYTVQFNSNNAALKGNLYAIVVSAGKKKVTASAVAGEKFGKGGVAMKVDVGAGLNVSGQVVAESRTAVNKDGKKMVWIPQEIGSNIPGHWVEEGSAEAAAHHSSGRVRTDDVRKRMDHGVSPTGSR